MNNKEENIIRLEVFKDLYDSALLSVSDLHDKMNRNMSQYMGSAEIDGSSEQATVVRNITYELIETQISSDVPVPKVDVPCYSERGEQNALNIERLCSSLRNRLPFEEMNDRDERYTYIYGGSVWYVEWDNADSSAKIHCISPFDFIPQPGICSVKDMEYCFLRFTTTKGELMRKYGVKESDTALADCEYQYENTSGSDTVTVIVCFYRDEDGEIGRFVFSGELVLSDEPKYYKRKTEICLTCHKPRGKCSCERPKFKKLDDDIEVVTDGSVPTVKAINYYTPREFPIIIRKNNQGENSLYGGSDCERIRAQQQALNKVESRILQKLIRAGITPIIPENSTVTLTNAVFGQVIKMRAGESTQNYGKIDTTPDISQDIKEADRLYDQAKRILGISDALQGTDNLSSSESGYALQLKINQATSRLESKRRLKYLAYSEIYRQVFQHYLAFSDEPRPLCYKDAFGEVHLSEFNRHDFIESDGYGGFCYSDYYLFSVDLNGGSEYQRETLWERNLSNLESGTLGDKTSPSTLLRYWQSQERAHYPYARENVEYFKALVEKQNIKEREKTNE